MQVPAVVVLPRRVLELMLHVKQPYPSRGGEERDREMHEQERLDADKPREHSDDDGDREIGCHCADARLPTIAHEADREPLLQKKKVCWSVPEHDQRVPVKTVFHTTPPGKG